MNFEQQSKHMIAETRYRQMSSDDLYRNFAKPLRHKRIKDAFLEPLEVPFRTDLRSSQSCHGDGLEGPSLELPEYANYVALNPEKVMIMRKFFNSQRKSKHVSGKHGYKRRPLMPDKPKKCNFTTVSDTALSSSRDRTPEDNARKEIRSAENCRCRVEDTRREPSPSRWKNSHFITECDGPDLFGINTYNINLERICNREERPIQRPTKKERSHQHIRPEPLQSNDVMHHQHKHNQVPHTDSISGTHHSRNCDKGVQVHHNKNENSHDEEHVGDKHPSRLKTQNRYSTPDRRSSVSESSESTIKNNAKTEAKTVSPNAKETQTRFEIKALRHIKQRLEKLEKKVSRNEAATANLQNYITEYIIKARKGAPADPSTLEGNNLINDQLWRAMSKNKHVDYKLALPVLLIWNLLIVPASQLFYIFGTGHTISHMKGGKPK